MKPWAINTTQNVDSSELHMKHIHSKLWAWSTLQQQHHCSPSCVFAESGVGAGIDSYYEYLMKAYILLGDNVFLERFNIVSSQSLCQIFYWSTVSPSCTCSTLNTYCKIISLVLIFVDVVVVLDWRHISWIAYLFFMMFVYNSTTVPLWSTSVSLPYCSMYTCTTPLWACAAGWTLSWRSSLAYRSGMLA